MSLWLKMSEQFGKPSGILGRIAGLIMEKRRSNQERTAWAVSIMGLKPTDRVLEIGFGPGLGVRMMAEITTEGTVWGIDHSAIMFDQASRRNREAIRQGRVKLMPASVSDLTEIEDALDKILDVNSFQYWENPVENLAKLRSFLRSGGSVFLVHQPRKPGATEEDADKAADLFARHLEESGFRDIKIAKHAMKPVPTVCVDARK